MAPPNTIAPLTTTALPTTTAPAQATTATSITDDISLPTTAGEDKTSPDPNTAAPTTLEHSSPITNNGTMISTTETLDKDDVHTLVTSQTTTTGPTLDDTTVQNAFHVSDSQIAIFLSAASLAVSIVLVIAFIVAVILHAQKKATNKTRELMKEDSKMNNLKSTPTRSFHTYTSPIFNPYDSEEKNSS